MTSLLMRLFVHDLSGYQPRIVDLEEPISIVGISTDTTLKGIYRDVARLGRQFQGCKLHDQPG